LEGIELGTKIGRQSVEEVLGGSIRVFCEILLCAPAPTIVITILVVNVDTVELLIVNDADEARGELVLLAKAVIPAIILVTRPRATHAGTAKTQNNLLPSSPPLIDQILIVPIITNRHLRGNATLGITDILALGPTV